MRHRGEARVGGPTVLRCASLMAATLAVAWILSHGQLFARAPQEPVSMPGREVQLWAGPPVVPPVLVTSELTERIRAREAVPESSSFIVSYSGFSAQAQAAFQFAVNIWAAQLTSSVPIRVSASWTDLCTPNGYAPGCGILGSAGPHTFIRDFSGAPLSGTWYPVAIANRLYGSDLDAAAVDIDASFNSTWGSWYYGTDGHPGAGQVDFVSVVLHELGHGVGFLGMAGYSGGTGSLGYGGYPSIWDRYVMNGSGTSLWTGFTNPSVALGSQLTSNSLYWYGTYGVAGAGGSYPRLYAPSTWSGGSSYSHLNEATYPAGNANSLMTPSIGSGEAIQDPGPITRGILRDSGWGVVAAPRDLAIAFPGHGTWTAQVAGSGWAWTMLHGSTMGPLASGDFDGNGREDLVAYLPGSGVWIRYDDGTWYYLHSLAAYNFVTGDLDGNGKCDIVIDFGPSGTWKYMNNSTWVSLHYLDPGAMRTGDFDGNGKADVMIGYSGSGTWIFYNNTTWSMLHTLVPEYMVTGDFDGGGKDDAVIDYGASGLWLWRNQTTWTQLHASSPGTMAAGDFDGDNRAELAISLAGSGIWGWDYSLGWTFLHGTLPHYMVAGDLDGNGQEELVIDFGVSVWSLFNWSSWRMVHSLDAGWMVAGKFR